MDVQISGAGARTWSWRAFLEGRGKPARGGASTGAGVAHGGGAGAGPGRLMHKLHPLGRGSNPLPLLTEPPIFVHLPRGVSFFLLFFSQRFF